jgi:hypothetical protein
MDSNIFLKIKELFDSTLSVITNSKEKLEQEYIDKNKQYQDGEKVKLYKDDKYQGEGIVVKTKIKDMKTGELEPVIHKVDENGNVQQGRWWFPFGFNNIRK